MEIDHVLISVLPGDRRAAALAGGRLARLVLAGGDDEIRVGDVILGRMMKIAGSVGCAFVDIGRGPQGVLMRDDVPAGRPLAEGEAVLCQVLREAIGAKGPKLTARLPSISEIPKERLEGVRPPCRIARGPDPLESLLRDAAPLVRRVVVDDGRELSRWRAAVPELADRLEPWLQPAPLFAASGVDEAIERALAPVVPLPSGGRLTIEETEALVAIDVDTGAAANGSAKSAALAGDLEAAAAIGKEIIARDLAGVVVIDFVPLRRATERERVLAALRSALAGDDRQLRIAGWTRLGLVELSRERRGRSLADRLTTSCLACGELGRMLSPRWVAGNALRALLAEARRARSAPSSLAVAPAVLEQLRGPLAAATAEVEGRLGAAVRLIPADTVPGDGYHLVAPGVEGDE